MKFTGFGRRIREGLGKVRWMGTNIEGAREGFDVFEFDRFIERRV